MSELIPGTLALISGIKERVVFLDGSQDPIDLNGVKCQLLQYHQETKQWLAVTFAGRRVLVHEQHFSRVTAKDLAGFDLVLGPLSDDRLLRRTLSRCMWQKGYATMHFFMNEAEVKEVHDLAKELDFARPPIEFESSYLGKNSPAKTVLVDFAGDDVPQAVMDSSLSQQDARFSHIKELLDTHSQSELGFELTSRTSLMIRVAFDDARDLYESVPNHATSQEVEDFVVLLKRRRMCLLHFVGPGVAKLTLRPVAGTEGTIQDIDCATNTLVAFSTWRYNYSFEAPPGSVALQTWFLSPAPQLALVGDLIGDIEGLSVEMGGPQPPKGDPVSVMGLGVDLAVDSTGHHKFWCAINKGGGDAQVEIPITRWDHASYYDPDRSAGQMSVYSKHCGLIDGIEYFDARFFGISNAEASAMDPQQRKTLETSFSALHMAGYEKKDLTSKPHDIGCMIGIADYDWMFVPDKPADVGGCGTALTVLSNRVNFALNLKGPSFTVDTACSAGLTALNAGKLHLLSKTSEILEGVIAGGVNAALHIGPYLALCSGGMLSPKGRCFSFNASSDGYARGEGSSCVYIQNKPYTKEIIAALAGSNVNQDGRSASLTAPNGPSQEKCIRAAFRDAGSSLSETDCFECHGTGTALGDPIEVGAIKRVSASGGALNREIPVVVTTSKSNIGHLEGGAGMAGFIKIVLQVCHCEGSPNIHLRELNPHLEVDGFAQYFVSEGVVFKNNVAMCGVSSFGFGGTNGHCLSYGKNTYTSRGFSMRQARQAFIKKVHEAPPSDIWATSDGDWGTDGIPFESSGQPKKFKIELQGDKVTCREVHKELPPTTGNSFYLSGSFNHWQTDIMARDNNVPELHVGRVVVGPSGSETFQVVADETADLTYHPESTKPCSSAAAPVEGPANSPPQHQAWLIRARPGQSVRVEFFRAEETVTINWIRE